MYWHSATLVHVYFNGKSQFGGPFQTGIAQNRISKHVKKWYNNEDKGLKYIKKVFFKIYIMYLYIFSAVKMGKNKSSDTAFILSLIVKNLETLLSTSFNYSPNLLQDFSLVDLKKYDDMFPTYVGVFQSRSRPSLARRM